MEDNKIRVGITQGDINGVGYEVILKTFADPVMLIIVNHWTCLPTSVSSTPTPKRFPIA